MTLVFESKASRWHIRPQNFSKFKLLNSVLLNDPLEKLAGKIDFAGKIVSRVPVLAPGADTTEGDLR